MRHGGLHNIKLLRAGYAVEHGLFTSILQDGIWGSAPSQYRSNNRQAVTGKTLAPRTVPELAAETAALRGYHFRSLFDQQLAEHRTMTMGFVLAVTTDREIGLAREGREQFDGMTVFRRRHLGPILFDKPRPLSRSFRLQSELHRRQAGREIRKPDVIPVLRGKLRLGDTARRTAHGANAQAFLRLAC